MDTPAVDTQVQNDAALKILEKGGHDTTKMRNPAPMEAGAAPSVSTDDSGVPTPTPTAIHEPQPEEPAAAPQSPTAVAVENPNDGGVASPSASAPEQPQVAQPQTATPEINDDVVKGYLEKKYGKSFESLDAIAAPKTLTAEEQEAESQRRKDEAIAFGIKEKLFTGNELKQYHADAARNPRETAYEVFKAQLQQHNPSITEEEVTDRFEEYFYEREEDGHPIKAIQQQAMKTIHENYIANKYGHIMGVDGQYESHIQQTQQAAGYAKNLDNVLNDIGNGTSPYKMEFKVGDNTYTYQVKPEVVKEIMQEYRSVDMFNALGENANNSQALKGLIDASLKQKELSKIIAEVAESHAAGAKLKWEAELAAVPQRPVSGGTPTNTSTTTVQPSGPAAAILRKGGYALTEGPQS